LWDKTRRQRKEGRTEEGRKVSRNGRRSGGRRREKREEIRKSKKVEYSSPLSQSSFTFWFSSAICLLSICFQSLQIVSYNICPKFVVLMGEREV
jgi:hypothetical protein